MASHIFFFVTIMLSISLATSLNCYACNRNTCKSGTYTKIDCNAQTGNIFVDTLKAATTPQCIKIEGIDASGNHFQERNCTAKLGPSVCSLLGLTENAKNLQCFTCDTNYCNSGTILFAALSLLISPFLFLF